MQIFLELTQDQDGRLSGSARLASTPEVVPSMPFSGTLGLVAVLEELCQPTQPTSAADTVAR